MATPRTSTPAPEPGKQPRDPRAPAPDAARSDLAQRERAPGDLAQRELTQRERAPGDLAQRELTQRERGPGALAQEELAQGERGQGELAQRERAQSEPGAADLDDDDPIPAGELADFDQAESGEAEPGPAGSERAESEQAGSDQTGLVASDRRRAARVRLTPEQRRERRKKRSARLRSELLNLPNGVTMARIALIPVFLAFLTYENRRNSFIAAVIFSIAALSDWIDGWLARVTNKITTLGKFLDPLADKLIVLSSLVMLLKLGRVPVWVVVLVFAREFLISGLRTIAASEGLVISASQGGKWKTSLQLTGIICLFVHYHFRIDYFVGSLQTDFQAVGATLVYLSLIPSVASAIEYVRAFYTLESGDGRS